MQQHAISRREFWPSAMYLAATARRPATAVQVPQSAKQMAFVMGLTITILLSFGGDRAPIRLGNLQCASSNAYQAHVRVMKFS